MTEQTNIIATIIAIVAVVIAVVSIVYTYNQPDPVEVDLDDIDTNRNLINVLQTQSTDVTKSLNDLRSMFLNTDRGIIDQDDLNDLEDDFINDIEDVEDDLDDAERDIREIFDCYEDNDSHIAIRNCIRDI